ncbi:hypothetical protein AV521_32465 [Streptomyces sp. IMTB 2501]|uniref:hypothetical protein n=1 Tax=Streptomyces sp. IMTB 2501 TaxID=1776340 RepID=UPI00096F80C7|nr:hypothetical protein [Streptomyces sp. IMTB 2501]OLZ65390.1 hypothetical protein AV521_32465 [Streptomyces sp. IMTB 2501]
MSRMRQLAVVVSSLALATGGLIVTTTGTAHAADCSQSYLPLQDPTCQPGALNSDVTQSTIDSTICVPGYSSSIRPSTSYTNALKVKQIAEYGYDDTATADYEEDHLIPLSLGGNPTSEQNLWPEPRYDAGGYTSSDKDTIEYKLYKAVCAGTIQLAPAQQAIATDWTTALQAVGLS